MMLDSPPVYLSRRQGGMSGVDNRPCLSVIAPRGDARAPNLSLAKLEKQAT